MTKEQICQTCEHWDQLSIDKDVGFCEEAQDEKMSLMFCTDGMIIVRSTFGCRLWAARSTDGQA